MDATTIAYCPRCGIESRYSSASSALASAEAHAANKGHAVEITMPNRPMIMVEPATTRRRKAGR